MPRAARFATLLILGLGLLTVLAAILVHGQLRAWSEKDLNLRARLAVIGARGELIQAWSGNPGGLLTTLSRLARDERILGACACGGDGATLARTTGLPEDLRCPDLVARIAREGVDPIQGLWARTEPIPGGDVHVSAVPLAGPSGTVGYVVLVHDLSYVALRDTRSRLFLLAGFGVLALCASILTIVASRISWRNWSTELREALHDGGRHKHFQPILADMRELVDQLVGQEGQAWTPQRLKETLRHLLSGEKVVVLSNREPYLHQRDPLGGIQIMHPASGVVTALEPVLRACSGTWIAHGSGTADRECSDRDGRLLVPPGEESYTLRRVWLSKEEEQGYYFGFSNEGLWPLCHIAHTRPVFRSEDWEHYRAVNKKFVDTVLEEVDTDDPIVLVQDYHFALAPALIRKALPRATVIMFWHIPWPNPELFGICPYRDELLEGMLGASILGFHTRFHCNNFLGAVDRFLEARIDQEKSAVILGGHETRVEPYPISVEWPMRQLVGVPGAKQARTEVGIELHLGPDVRLGVGVDRLDYTKGIEERLLAVERMFELFPEHIGRFTFVQLAAPSRTHIDRYRLLNEQVEAVAKRIDARYGNDSWHPVVLLRAHHEPPTVFRYLRAADLVYVSSLHDGMNLVAKEFIAAREDERGVLVLSQFTGAARELTEALIVNPYDLDEAAAALAAALDMEPEEQAVRMRSMRRYVAEFNVYSWAGRMLLDAARLRRSERLSQLLSEPESTRGSPEPARR